MSQAEDGQITALRWGGVLPMSLGSPRVRRGVMSPRPVSPPLPSSSRRRPLPSPRPSRWPLASMPRSHLPHAPCLCGSLSCTHFLSSSCPSSCIPGLREGDKDWCAGGRGDPL